MALIYKSKKPGDVPGLVVECEIERVYCKSHRATGMPKVIATANDPTITPTIMK